MTDPYIEELEDMLDGSEALFLEPRDLYDVAIIGVCDEGDTPTIAYDAEKCISALAAQEGWDREAAIEWFHFNTLGAYVGPETPIFITLTRSMYA